MSGEGPARPVGHRHTMAQVAAGAVDARAHAENPDRHQYRDRAVGFPALVQAAGLCQALAFLQTKSGGRGKTTQAYQAYRSDLGAVLNADPDELAEQARTLPVTSYILLTRRAMEAAVWLKHYAEAFIEPKEPEVVTEEETSHG